AVHDAIRHGEAQLKTYEDTLHVVEKETERQQIVSRLRTLLKNDETAAALLDRLV
ncbi:MAG: DNA-binding protein, partial [Firmicutes bacterium]|nr:DNA-binding protein [Bacillota bacterium]